MTARTLKRTRVRPGLYKMEFQGRTFHVIADEGGTRGWWVAPVGQPEAERFAPNLDYAETLIFQEGWGR